MKIDVLDTITNILHSTRKMTSDILDVTQNKAYGTFIDLGFVGLDYLMRYLRHKGAVKDLLQMSPLELWEKAAQEDSVEAKIKLIQVRQQEELDRLYAKSVDETPSS